MKALGSVYWDSKYKFRFASKENFWVYYESVLGSENFELYLWNRFGVYYWKRFWGR